MQDEQKTKNQELDVANKIRRGINFMVDSTVFFIIFILIGKTIEAFNLIPPRYGIILLPILMIVHVTYYTLMEYYFGKTLGKFLTKTKVAKKDGSKPTFMNLVGRNFARFIPYDPMSFIYSGKEGWHDLTSGTCVVNDKKS